MQLNLYYSRFLDDLVLIGLAGRTQASLRLFDFQAQDLDAQSYLQSVQDNPDTLLMTAEIEVDSDYGEALTLEKLGAHTRALLTRYDESTVVYHLLNQRASLRQEEHDAR
jgi:hypothetical protein